MGVVCSIGFDRETFASALQHGCSGIELSPRGDNGPCYGAVIRGFSLEAALGRRSNLPPSLLQRAERAVRRSPFPLQVATTTALEAWEYARLQDVPIPGDRLAIVVGGSNLTSRYAEAMRPCFERNPMHLSGRFALCSQDTDHVGTLSEILGITGEGFTVGGASASGNIGIISGSRLVELGAADACLVLGALCDLTAMEMQAFLNVGAMAGCSPGDGAQAAGAPFDIAHAGFIPGQGCACLVLESGASAAQRGVNILAEIGGYASHLAGNRLADPSEEREAAVMGRAIRQAGLEPHDVAYVNMHGSGSILGDEVEVRALRRALGSAFETPWVNSTKSLTGHCLAAAGVLEAVATVIQMQAGFVHPNAGLKNPIDTGCRFVGCCARNAAIPSALSNSFGFGGINTSILLVHPDVRS
jgi:malonyl-ACP decarboxylase